MARVRGLSRRLHRPFAAPQAAPEIFFGVHRPTWVSGKARMLRVAATSLSTESPNAVGGIHGSSRSRHAPKGCETEHRLCSDLRLRSQLDLSKSLRPNGVLGTSDRVAAGTCTAQPVQGSRPSAVIAIALVCDVAWTCRHQRDISRYCHQLEENGARNGHR